MKKYFSIVLILVFCVCFALPASAEFDLWSGFDTTIAATQPSFSVDDSDTSVSEAFVYTDEELGLSFTVPAGWKESTDLSQSSENNAPMKKAFENDDTFAYIVYGYTDTEKVDIDNDYFTEESLAEYCKVDADAISTVEYNGLNFWMVEKDGVAFLGSELPIYNVNMMYIKNGIILSFQFMGDKNGEEFKDFESLIASINLNDSDSLSNAYRFGAILGNYIVYILFLLLPNSIPILIFRYLIMRRPVSKKKAKIISVIYAIFSLLFSSFVFVLLNKTDFTFAFVVALWGIVNYRILIKNKKTIVSTTEDRAEESECSSESVEGIGEQHEAEKVLSENEETV